MMLQDNSFGLVKQEVTYFVKQSEPKVIIC